MALIVDDSVDVWRDDLRNLCLCRRFVGDPSDDGLQCLSWQLQLIHSSFYAAVRDSHKSFSLEDAECPRPPDVRDVLATHRGKLLANCKICLTGVLPEQTDDELARQPLCMLVRLYGGTVSLSMDACTHLVARKKDGWLRSSKIQRAIQMSEVWHAQGCERVRYCEQRFSRRCEHARLSRCPRSIFNPCSVVKHRSSSLCGRGCGCVSGGRKDKSRAFAFPPRTHARTHALPLPFSLASFDLSFPLSMLSF